MLVNIWNLRKSEFFKSSSYVFVGLIGNKALAFMLSLLLANILAPERFGVYALLKVSIFSLGSLAVLGQNLVINKILSQQQSLDLGPFYRLFVATFCISMAIACTAIFGGGFVRELYHIPKTAAYSNIIFLGIPVVALDAISQSALVAVGRVKGLALINSVSGLLGFGGGLALVGPFGIEGALFAYVVSLLMGLCGMLVLLCRGHKWSQKTGSFFGSTQFRHNGLALGLQEVVFTGVNLLMSIVVARALGHESFAVFNIAVQWVALSHLMSTVFKNPLITSAAKSTDARRRLLLISMLLATGFSIIFALLVYGVNVRIPLYPLYGLEIAQVIGWAIVCGVPKQLFGILLPFAVVVDMSWPILVARILRDTVIVVTLFCFTGNFGIYDFFCAEGVIYLLFVTAFVGFYIWNRDQ